MRVTIGKSTIYNMDCMELLKATPDKFYDLAIVDPPYGINVIDLVYKGRVGVMTKTKHGFAKKGQFHLSNFDKNRPSIEYFFEIVRVSKNQIIWGGNHFADYLPPSTGWIFWDKVNGTNDFSDGELAWTSFKKGIRQIEYMWNGMLQGRAPPNGRVVQGDKKLCENKIHPTQKPVKLYEWLLTNYAKQGDKILDTHLGSGSHAIACNNLGFELTACELDTDYYEASIKRIQQATAQERLFA